MRFRSLAGKLLMLILPLVSLSSIVGVYQSLSSKSPDIRWHSRWHFHLPYLPIVVVLGNIPKGNGHEGILIPRARLHLWTGYTDPAHHDRTDTSEAGQAPGYLPQSGGGMGSRPQLSQN